MGTLKVFSQSQCSHRTSRISRRPRRPAPDLYYGLRALLYPFSHLLPHILEFLAAPCHPVPPLQAHSIRLQHPLLLHTPQSSLSSLLYHVQGLPLGCRPAPRSPFLHSPFTLSILLLLPTSLLHTSCSLLFPSTLFLFFEQQSCRLG